MLLKKYNHPHHNVIPTSHTNIPYHIHISHQRMARNLETWQNEIIVHMICSRKLTISQMAKVAKCSERSITNIHKNMRLFGSARSPPIPAGRPPSITSPMLEALCDYLAKKPSQYVEEMAVFSMGWIWCTTINVQRQTSTFPSRVDKKESPAESKRIEPSAARFLPA